MKSLKQFFRSNDDELSQECYQYLKDGYRPAIIFWRKETGIVPIDESHVKIEANICLTNSLETSEACQLLTKGLWELKDEG